jgi:hypothetical protein
MKTKNVLFAVVVAAAVWLVLQFTPQPGLTARVVELPAELAAIIAGAVFWLVSTALTGHVPDEAVQRIAAAITAGLLEILAVLLGLIPPEFEDLARALLNLLVIILGAVSGVKLLFAGAQAAYRKLTAKG